ncbi:MAG: tRNA lysidine(34) synthetase TilS [Bdellovibrionales bacterium]
MSHLLFHKTLDFFKSQAIENKKLCLGISGGVDSMVLLDVMSQVASPLNLKLVVIHVHHGATTDASVRAYRDKVGSFVTSVCRDSSFPFYLSQAPLEQLKSEQEFRTFRYQQFEKYIKEEQAAGLVLAHNSDDALETRLIHLIRGCGLEGLKAMDSAGWLGPDFEKNLIRPFLSFSKGDILDYAQKKSLKWLEDPSNSQQDFLRNWLRNAWLIDLEKKRPGSRFRLGQSLDKIASSFSESEDLLPYFINSKRISRPLFKSLSRDHQKRLLALYMKKENIRNYGQSHIEEVLKHLERPNKHMNLDLLKRKWKITPDFFYVEEIL